MPAKTIKNKDPVKAFIELKDAKNVCFLHGYGKNKWNSVLAWDPVAKFSYKSESKQNGLKEFQKFALTQNKKGRKLIGYISYDLGYELHNIKKTAKDDLQLPDIYFLAFDNWTDFKNNKIEQSPKQETAQAKEKKTEQNFSTKITREKYSKNYEKIKNYIKAGDIYQINYTHRLEAKTKIPARELFLKTIKDNKVSHIAYIEGDGFEIISASPERFIKIEKEKIETSPIKGTRPRGATPSQDKKLKKELLASEKEAAELNMITDLLRNDIGKIAKIGSVKVKESRVIQKYPTVWHTHSKITGKIATPPLEALISMLPGGSITGCPKKRAIEIIDELEPTTRGIYTGIIGQIDPKQNLDFNIAIRTIIKKDKNLYLQVGGGIVLDSTDKAEFKETLDKAKSFMKIL